MYSGIKYKDGMELSLLVKKMLRILWFLMEQMHMGLSYNVRFTVSGKVKSKHDEMALEASKSWSDFLKKNIQKL